MGIGKWLRRNSAQMTIGIATRDRRVLEYVWRELEGVDPLEMVSTEALLRFLPRVHLVVIDPDDLVAIGLDPQRAVDMIRTTGVPHATPQEFLNNPEHYLAEARAFRGDVHALPPRIVAFTSLDSGGVGKTTLTLNTALEFNRRTRMPVAVVELTRAASGFLSILASRGVEKPFPDVYDMLTQNVSPEVWETDRAKVSVVPMSGRTVSLISPETFGEFLRSIGSTHAFTVVDAVQPHPLWPVTRETVDTTLIVAAAGRPETVTNAHLLAEEMPESPIVLNMARALDRIATAGEQYIRVPFSRDVAALRGRQELDGVFGAIWPYYKQW